MQSSSTSLTPSTKVDNNTPSTAIDSFSSPMHSDTNTLLAAQQKTTMATAATATASVISSSSINYPLIASLLETNAPQSAHVVTSNTVRQLLTCPQPAEASHGFQSASGSEAEQSGNDGSSGSLTLSRFRYLNKTTSNQSNEGSSGLPFLVRKILKRYGSNRRHRTSSESSVGEQEIPNRESKKTDERHNQNDVVGTDGSEAIALSSRTRTSSTATTTATTTAPGASEVTSNANAASKQSRKEKQPRTTSSNVSEAVPVTLTIHHKPVSYLNGSFEGNSESSKVSSGNKHVQRNSLLNTAINTPGYSIATLKQTTPRTTSSNELSATVAATSTINQTPVSYFDGSFAKRTALSGSKKPKSSLIATLKKFNYADYRSVPTTATSSMNPNEEGPAEYSTEQTGNVTTVGVEKSPTSRTQFPSEEKAVQNDKQKGNSQTNSDSNNGHDIKRQKQVLRDFFDNLKKTRGDNSGSPLKIVTPAMKTLAGRTKTCKEASQTSVVKGSCRHTDLQTKNKYSVEDVSRTKTKRDSMNSHSSHRAAGESRPGASEWQSDYQKTSQDSVFSQQAGMAGRSASQDIDNSSQGVRDDGGNKASTSFSGKHVSKKMKKKHKKKGAFKPPKVPPSLPKEFQRDSELTEVCEQNIELLLDLEEKTKKKSFELTEVRSKMVEVRCKIAALNSELGELTKAESRAVIDIETNKRLHEQVFDLSKGILGERVSTMIEKAKGKRTGEFHGREADLSGGIEMERSGVESRQDSRSASAIGDVEDNCKNEKNKKRWSGDGRRSTECDDDRLVTSKTTKSAKVGKKHLSKKERKGMKNSRSSVDRWGNDAEGSQRSIEVGQRERSVSDVDPRFGRESSHDSRNSPGAQHSSESERLRCYREFQRSLSLDKPCDGTSAVVNEKRCVQLGKIDGTEGTGTRTGPRKRSLGERDDRSFKPKKSKKQRTEPRLEKTEEGRSKGGRKNI
eukprot:gene17540-19290_t